MCGDCWRMLTTLAHSAPAAGTLRAPTIQETSPVITSKLSETSKSRWAGSTRKFPYQEHPWQPRCGGGLPVFFTGVLMKSFSPASRSAARIGGSDNHKRAPRYQSSATTTTTISQRSSLEITLWWDCVLTGAVAHRLVHIRLGAGPTCGVRGRVSVAHGDVRHTTTGCADVAVRRERQLILLRPSAGVCRVTSQPVRVPLQIKLGGDCVYNGYIALGRKRSRIQEGRWLPRSRELWL